MSSSRWGRMLSRWVSMKSGVCSFMADSSTGQKPGRVATTTTGRGEEMLSN